LIDAEHISKAFGLVVHNPETSPRSVFRRAIGGPGSRDNALMRAVADGCRDAVVITTGQGIIVTANQLAEGLFGQNMANLAARHIQSLLPKGAPDLAENRDAGPVEIDLTHAGPRRYELTISELDLPGAFWMHSFRDITDTTRRDEVRQATRAEARAASAAKAEFLHNMGHELRTPLNSVIGFSEILKDELFGPIGNEQYRQYLLAIHGCGVHLSQVVNAILDVSKIEAGVYELDESAFDIAALIADVNEVSQSWEFSRRLDLVCDPRIDGLNLTGDRRLIRHALLDILSNGMKFSPESDSVALTVGLSEGGNLSFEVQDNGIGIDPVHLDQVTDPFYQIDSTINRNFEGAGLGLYLARAYLEFHGGDLTISSAPDSGATVTLYFPSERVFPTEKISAAR
jgi:signal transduction histidine kinase